MKPASPRRPGCRATKDLLLVVLLLGFYPLTAPAGELLEVPGGPPLELTLPDLAGQPRNLEEFAGKVLLVNFWASWCSPCIEEMPGIQRLAEAMHDKPFAVIGVNVAEPVLRAKTMARRLRLEFPVLLDPDSAVFEDWGASVLPTTYILDGSGRVRYIARGPLAWDRADIIQRINDLLLQPVAHE